MDRLGDNLLAGAAFALNQDRGAAGSDLRDKIKDAKHGLAFAHDVGEIVALFEGALELEGFLPRRGGVRLRSGCQEEFSRPRASGNEILRAGANGLDDVVDCAVGGDHDNWKIGLVLLELRQKLDAALAGQREVEQDEVVSLTDSSMRSPSSPLAAVLTA